MVFPFTCITVKFFPRTTPSLSGGTSCSLRVTLIGISLLYMDFYLRSIIFTMSPETPIVIRPGEPYDYEKEGQVHHDQLTLTSYNLADAPDIFSLINRNQAFFTRYDSNWTKQPKYQSFEIFAETIKNPPNPNIHHFLVRNFKGEAVGGCRIQIDKHDPQSAEIGYFIDEQHTHNRYASRAVGILINYATNDLKLHELTAFVNPENIGSVTTLERNGFEFVGIDPENPTHHLFARSLDTNKVIQPEPTIPEDVRNELTKQANQINFLVDAVLGQPTLDMVGTRAWRAKRQLGIEITNKPIH